MLWVRISITAKRTTLCDKVCHWLATGRWFSPGPPVFPTNKTDRHDIAELLLKVALNIIKQTIYQNCPRPEYSWNTARWTLRNNPLSDVAHKSFTASTMLIRFLSCLVCFDIKNDVRLHTRNDWWLAWHSSLSKYLISLPIIFSWYIFCIIPSNWLTVV